MNKIRYTYLWQGREVRYKTLDNPSLNEVETILNEINGCERRFIEVHVDNIFLHIMHMYDCYKRENYNRIVINHMSLEERKLIKANDNYEEWFVDWDDKNAYFRLGNGEIEAYLPKQTVTRDYMKSIILFLFEHGKLPDEIEFTSW